MLRLIDSHCHLDFEAFDQDRAEVLSRASALGVEAVVVPGVQVQTWSNLLQLCSETPNLYAALGLHPYFILQHQEAAFDKLQEYLRANSDNLVAVGEIGVDATQPDLERQWLLFSQQLALAEQFDKPVIVHSLRVHDQLALRLKAAALSRGGVIHGFSGSYEQARRFVDLGYKIGVGGVISYARANKTREAIRRLPRDALLLETDAPDMPLQGYQGQRNSPEQLPKVLSALALLRGESAESLAATILRSTLELFRLDR